MVRASGESRKLNNSLFSKLRRSCGFNQFLLAWITFTFVFMPVLPAFAADIVVDSNRGGNTSLDTAQNGTPVININAPSRGGVSVNYYSDFNVTPKNVIFNNFQGTAGVSQLGGALPGNPNLNLPGARAADIILNEVTSNRVTRIEGYAEVFGKKADVIIANPNGIMVSGGGFINTSRLSLITGKSTGLDGNGLLNPFLLSDNPNAIITVTGRNVFDNSGNVVAYNLGIDGNNTDYVDLISRIVKINGDIYASKGVNVKTGNDKASYVSDGFTVTSTSKADKPEFSIDSAALGGIYAGRISFIATEEGVGVRSRSDLVSTVDDILFDAKGNIVLEDTGSVHARNNVIIKADETVTNKAMLVAQGGISITADKVENKEEIYSAGNLSMSARKIDNQGTFSTGTGDMFLSTTDAVNTGLISSGGAFSLTSLMLNNDAGRLLANRTLALAFGGLADYTITGALFSNADISITAGNIINKSDVLSASNIILNAYGNIYNGDANTLATISAFNDITLNAYKDGGVGGNIFNYGIINANNALTVNAEDSIFNDLDIGGNAKMNAGSSLSLTAGNRIINKGFIQSLGTLSMLTLATKNADYKLNNTTSGSSLNAIHQYLGELRLDINTASVEITGIHNYGRLYSGDDMALYSASVLHNNKGALIYAKGNIDFGVRDILFNTENALGLGIYSEKSISFHSDLGQFERLGQLINYDGRIMAEGNLSVFSVETINYGSDNIDIFTNPYAATGTTRALNFNLSYLSGYAVDDVRHYSTLTTNSSELISSGDMVVDSSAGIVNYNSLIFGDSVALSTAALVNKTSEFKVQDSAYIGAIPFLAPWDVLLTSTNSSARIAARNNVVIAANKIDNGAALSGILQNNSTYNPAGRLPYAPDVEAVSPLEQLANTGAINPADHITLPQGNYGMFRRPADPSSRFLYETDPFLIDVSRFLGSSYFLSRLGLDAANLDAKFLGDSYFEHEMIRRSLEQIPLFQNTITDNDQMTAYINNLYQTVTPELQTDLGLVFGEPLTKDQIAQLEGDIVWYVKQTMTLPGGEVVETYVPHVYLCQSTIDQLYGTAIADTSKGASISGDNVQIASLDPTIQSVLNNAGTIAGNRQVVITTDAINNASAAIGGSQATLIAGDLLYLNTGPDGTVNNISATMKTVNDGSLVYVSTGDLNNITHSQSETTEVVFDDFAFSQTTTKMGKEAEIKSKGDMIIETAGDLIMVGSTIESTGNMSLDVGGNLLTLAAQNRSSLSFDRKSKSGGILGETTTTSYQTGKVKNTISTISAGGDLNINVADTLLSVGTTFAAGGDLSLSADNMYLLNAVDSEYSSFYQKKESFDLGGAVVGVAAAAMTGGMISPNGAIAGAASAASSVSDLKKGTVTSFENYDETVIGTLLSGNNVNITTGKDAILVSTTVEALNDLTFDIGGQLYIGSAEEKHSSSFSHEKFGGDMMKAAGAGLMTGVAAGYASSTATSLFGDSAGLTMGISAGIGSADATSSLLSDTQRLDRHKSASVLQVSSDLYAGNNLVMNAKDDITISASDVTVGNNASLNSQEGNVNIISAAEKYVTYDETVRTGNFDNIGFSNTNSSVSISGSYHTTREAEEQALSLEKSSNIYVGNNLEIKAGSNEGNSVNIVASNLYAENDISIQAEAGNINVLSAEEIQRIRSEADKTEVTMSATVGNAWIDAAEKVYRSIDNMEDSKESYVNLHLNAASSAFETLATLNTLGFYSGANVSANTTETESTEINTFGKGSSIISGSGNISLTARDDINIEGSAIGSFGDNTSIDLIAGNNVNLTASQNSGASSSSMDSDTVSFGLSSKDIFGYMPSYDYMKTKTRGANVSYNNSFVFNDNGSVNIKSGNDTNIIGANVSAKDIDMDVGGNLTVASVQNTSSMNSKTLGGGASISGLTVKRTSGSASADRVWTDSQTSIIGSDSVNIKVKNNTDITGAMIANAEYDSNSGTWADNGNLTLNTGSLTYSNLIDADYNDDQMTSVGVGARVTVQHKTKGHETEGITFATLGEGAVNVGDGSDLSGLNRDVNNTQIITKDKDTGGYDIDVNIDMTAIVKMYKAGGIGNYTQQQLEKGKENLAKLVGSISSAYEHVKDAAVEAFGYLMDSLTPEERQEFIIDTETIRLVKVFEDQAAALIQEKIDGISDDKMPKTNEEILKLVEELGGSIIFTENDLSMLAKVYETNRISSEFVEWLNDKVREHVENVPDAKFEPFLDWDNPNLSKEARVNAILGFADSVYEKAGHSDVKTVAVDGKDAKGCEYACYLPETNTVMFNSSTIANPKSEFSKLSFVAESILHDGVIHPNKYIDAPAQFKFDVDYINANNNGYSYIYPDTNDARLDYFYRIQPYEDAAYQGTATGVGLFLKRTEALRQLKLQGGK